jgi:DNA modification methylase
MESWVDKIVLGDCREVLKQIPPESVDFVMFSPPYWGLRDYGEDADTDWGDWKGQLGLEPDFRMYVDHLVQIGDLIWRVLKKSGSWYLNIGDSYTTNHSERRQRIRGNLKEKCLAGIPWRTAIALMNRGWILRNDIIWVKPNHLPAPHKDRLTNAYEHLFHFVKSTRYYYNLDAIREPIKTESILRYQREYVGRDPNYVINAPLKHIREKLRRGGVRVPPGRDIPNVAHPLGKNPGDVWQISTRPFFGIHPAVYPPQLCVRPILSSCPPDGIVLDPMCGSGTTLAVAKALGRHYIGIEIVPRFVEGARERVAKVIRPLTPITKLVDALAAVEGI